MISNYPIDKTIKGRYTLETVLKTKGLSDKQLRDIKTLENICSKHEKLSMKLNWDMLNTRSTQQINDFLYYADNQLIGFLGLYGFGPTPKEIELTGMIHPEFRRRGLFRELFNEAKKECIARSVERILMITERSTPSGIHFIKSTDAQYTFSEYRMKFKKLSVPDFKRHGISLKKANTDDHKNLKQLDALCFGKADETTENNDSYPEVPYRTDYVAEMNDKFIGKIGITMEGESGYICGFAIKPEYRGLGYGRETLSLTLEKLLSEQIQTVLLEVAVKNENALTLYKSCGFKEDTIYDYYTIEIS